MQPRYVKTPKGIEEVERKAHGLTPKSRQVLIMINGKRDLADLQGIFPPEMVPPILAELIAGEFVRELEPPPPEPAPAPPAAKTATVPVAGNDEERYQLARNFMINTTSAFIGMSGSALIERVEHTGDLAGLSALYHDWHDSIALTGDGKKRLPELDQQLLKLLGEMPERPAAAKAPVPAGKAGSPKTEQAKRPADDDERLTMARNFMVNTTTTFIGMAGSTLVDRLEAAENIPALRQLYFDWRTSLELSGDARKRLPDLEKRLAALLS